MSQDIEYIKSILSSCEEIDDPFILKPGDIIKYITVTKGSEYFYEGGEYIRMGDNKIIIKEDKKNNGVPIEILSPEGDILYRSRFFVLIDNKDKGKTEEEYLKVIKTQQNIIEKLIKENTMLKKDNNKYIR